jgi:hypothetical protein
LTKTKGRDSKASVLNVSNLPLLRVCSRKCEGNEMDDIIKENVLSNVRVIKTNLMHYLSRSYNKTN